MGFNLQFQNCFIEGEALGSCNEFMTGILCYTAIHGGPIKVERTIRQLFKTTNYEIYVSLV